MKSILEADDSLSLDQKIVTLHKLWVFKQLARKSTEIQRVPSPQTVNFQDAISKLIFFSLFLSQNFLRRKKSKYSIHLHLEDIAKQPSNLWIYL